MLLFFVLVSLQIFEHVTSKTVGSKLFFCFLCSNPFGIVCVCVHRILTFLQGRWRSRRRQTKGPDVLGEETILQVFGEHGQFIFVLTCRLFLGQWQQLNSHMLFSYFINLFFIVIAVAYCRMWYFLFSFLSLEKYSYNMLHNWRIQYFAKSLRDWNTFTNSN